MPELRQFSLPDLGEGLLSAELVRWHVSVGDRVTDGMPVCEVETAKATVELPVPFDGVVHELCCPEGATVDVGTVIVVVAAEAAAPVQVPAGDATGPDRGAPPALLVGYGSTTGESHRWTARRAARQSVNGVRRPAGTPVNGAGQRGELLVKPPVRRLARDLGVDLAEVVPTGPGGTITRTDVEAAAPRPALAQAAPDRQETAPAAGARDRREPVTGIRRTMAKAMVASAFSAPHASESVTVDVTRTIKLVRRLAGDPAFAGRRVTPLLLVARALLAAIARNPEINARWDGERDEIVLRDHVNLGIAVAAPDGLLVPNVKDAHALSLPELAGAVTGLVERARAGRVAPAEMIGGTCTITNIGALGVDSGTPILNPGEPAILVFGAVRARPWVHKGRIAVRQTSTLTLTFDHRLVDGALGARVLTTVADALERPDRLIGWSR